MTAARTLLRVPALVAVATLAVGGCSSHAAPRSSSSDSPTSSLHTTATDAGPSTVPPPTPSTADRGSATSATGTSTPPPRPTAGSADAMAVPADWTEDEVTFTADGMTVYGTYTHPADGSARVPAAVLIAGSGPTDRNGNSPAIPGAVDSLRSLAAVLAADGVASLRYDKLGTGKTGLGDFASDPSAVGIDPFVHEAHAALEYLASRPQVDRDRLSVYGHSEGALFALLIATGAGDGAPAVRAVGLLEPLSKRYLDLITDQVTAQVRGQQQSRVLDDATAAKVLDLLHRAVTQLREKGTVPADMPYGLGTLLNANNLTFLREADAIDPADLAAKLPRHTRVLITCSDADIQVSCADAKRIADAVPTADFLHLRGVDHVLKEDDSRSPANYGKNLPFSTQLVAALGRFARLP